MSRSQIGEFIKNARKGAVLNLSFRASSSASRPFVGNAKFCSPESEVRLPAIRQSGSDLGWKGILPADHVISGRQDASRLAAPDRALSLVS